DYYCQVYDSTANVLF
nr:immunoglobulin light chain junction region [Macaca mulatta]MOV68172.1 immunoglobulin light chain junction region [Macaca mulatta]